MTTPSMISENTLDLRLELRRVPIVPEGECLTDETLLALARDDLNPLPSEILAHLDSCQGCVSKYDKAVAIIEYLRIRLAALFANPRNWAEKPESADAHAKAPMSSLVIDFLEYSLVELPKTVLITVSSDRLELTGESICVEIVSISGQDDVHVVFPSPGGTSVNGKFVKNPSGTKTICRIAVCNDDWNSLPRNQNLKIRLALARRQ
ncbi:MAG: hypothetical protein ACRER2_04120 [Methylococcales bacterium]